MYRPKDGAFPQNDPIGYDGGANLSAYVQADPINLVDPLGLGCNDLAIPPGFKGIVITGRCPPPSNTGWEHRDTSLRSPGERNSRDARDSRPGPNRPERPKPKSKPEYCKSQLYQFANDVDRLGARAQAAALGAGLLGKTEPYAVARAAFERGSVAAYKYIGVARLGANFVKAYYGDYGSSAKDVILNVVGKAVGGDALLKSLADFGVDVASDTFIKSPCDDN